MGKGKLLIISGFSGVGKGTVIRTLMERHPGEYVFSVSATTRPPRPGETDGVDYHFITEEAFSAMIENGDFFEYAGYQGKHYGTPKAPVYENLEAGRSVVFDIEVNGALNIKRMEPEALSIFLIPPSAGALYDRLTGRGTETPEQVLGRMKRSAEEAAFAERYDAILVNQDLERCVDEVEELIETGSQSRFAKANNAALCRRLKTDIEALAIEKAQ